MLKEFKAAINSKWLTFQEGSLEELFQEERDVTTRKAFVKLMSVVVFPLLFGYTFSIYDQLVNKPEGNRKETNYFRFIWITISFLITIVEYLNIKYGPRKLRACFIIFVMYVAFAFDPKSGKELAFGGMWYAYTNLIAGQHFSYNWILGSLATFLGVSTYFLLNLIWDQLVPEHLLFVLFIQPSVMLLFYHSEYEIRKSFFLLQQSLKKEGQWKAILDELPEGVIVSTNIETKYINPKAKALCEALNIEEGVELAKELEELGGTGELITREEQKVFLESGHSHKINFESSECVLYLIKDQTALKKREHKILQEEYSTMLLCSLSHELRTPLNGIVGVLETLHPQLVNMQCCPKCAASKGDNVDLCLHALRNSKLLWYLVNGILALTQSEAGELQFEFKEIRMINCVQYCLELVSQEITTRNLLLQEDYCEKILQNSESNDPQIVIDEIKYQIILISLLLNATKYTFTGEINVCVWMEDNYLLTSVEDTGIGMSELEMNSLFHMFRKLDQPKLQHGRASSLTPRPSNTSLHGAGFGLTVSRQLTEIMGGKIWVETKENVGSKFTFSLPNREFIREPEDKETLRATIETNMSVPNEPQMGTVNYSFMTTIMITLDEQKIYDDAINPPHSETHLPISNVGDQFNKSLKILIIDDTSSNIFVLKLLLNRMDLNTDWGFLYLAKQILHINQGDLLVLKIYQDLVYQEEKASNGLEGIEKMLIKKQNYSLIFMDCNMPIMDGFEATRELKYKMERGEIKNIPIVGLTAYAGQKVEQDCYRAGMDAIYYKPISVMKLKECLMTFNIPFNNSKL